MPGVWWEGKEIGTLPLRHLQNIKDAEKTNSGSYIGFQIAFTNIITPSHIDALMPFTTEEFRNAGKSS